MATSQTPAYKGTSRRVVIAFDIGTTFSGVSYCILDPGVVPKICSLTRCAYCHNERLPQSLTRYHLVFDGCIYVFTRHFLLLRCCRYPGQEHVAGSPKIPTVMYYDSAGKMRSAGAETQLPETTETAEEEEWLKVEWCVPHQPFPTTLCP